MRPSHTRRTAQSLARIRREEPELFRWLIALPPRTPSSDGSTPVPPDYPY